jgi:hypothetical protein
MLFTFQLARLVLLLASLFCVATHAIAQPQPTSLPRQSGGWQASQVSAADSPVGQELAPIQHRDVQTAFFQSQGSLSDGLPILPAGLNGQPPALPSYFGGSGTPGQSAPSGLPPGGLSGYPPSSSVVSPPPIGAAGHHPAPHGIAPPAQPQLPQLNEPQNARLRGLPAEPVSGQLRSIPNQASSTGSGDASRLNPQDITSGLPYVTPAPRSRYPTSPYQPAVFQTTASPAAHYQNAGMRAQLASTTRSPSNYLTTQQAALPQYQTPGIYPTSYQQCQPMPGFAGTGQVPGTYIPPTLTPNLAPGIYSPTNAGYRPLFSLGQENYNVQLGRGIIGQPTAYVSGQPIRNFLRYLSP